MPLLDPSEDEAEIVVTLDLPLDRETIVWLSRMSRDDMQAGELVASMVRSIREDDEEAHRVMSLH